MKRILIFISILIVINITLNFSLFNYGLRNIPDFQNGKKYWSKDKSHFNRLFIGNSLPFYDIDQSLLPNSFNLANNGATYVQTYYLLEKILKSKNHTIDTVFIPYNEATFTDFKTEHYNTRSYYWRDFLNYKKLGREKKDISTFISLEIQAKFFPYAEIFAKKINQIIKPAPDKKDFNTNILTEKESEILAEKLLKKELLRRHLMSDLCLTYHNRLIELCNTHEVMLIFIRYPTTKEHEIKMKKIKSKLNLSFEPYNLALKKSNNYLILDFKNLYRNRYDYFLDAVHLNEKGKKAFSIHLNERINNLN